MPFAIFIVRSSIYQTIYQIIYIAISLTCGKPAVVLELFTLFSHYFFIDYAVAATAASAKLFNLVRLTKCNSLINFLSLERSFGATGMGLKMLILVLHFHFSNFQPFLDIYISLPILIYWESFHTDYICVGYILNFVAIFYIH